MRGRSVSTSSSWNDDSSHTTQASGAAEPTSDVSGRPMLPVTSTGRPAASKTAPSNAVVVVLPLVPVTPRMGFGSSLAPSSISEITGRPRTRAASTERRPTLDPRAFHHEVDPVQERSVAGAETDVGAERDQRRGIELGRAVVPDHLVAPREQRSGRGLARAGQPEHEHPHSWKRR